MAEYHWTPLYRLLKIVYEKRGNLVDAAIVDPLSRGEKILQEHLPRQRQILQEELVIINWLELFLYVI